MHVQFVWHSVKAQPICVKLPIRCSKKPSISSPQECQCDPGLGAGKHVPQLLPALRLPSRCQSGTGVSIRVPMLVVWQKMRLGMSFRGFGCRYRGKYPTSIDRYWSASHDMHAGVLRKPTHCFDWNNINVTTAVAWYFGSFLFSLISVTPRHMYVSKCSAQAV